MSDTDSGTYEIPANLAKLARDMGAPTITHNEFHNGISQSELETSLVTYSIANCAALMVVAMTVVNYALDKAGVAEMQWWEIASPLLVMLGILVFLSIIASAAKALSGDAKADAAKKPRG